MTERANHLAVIPAHTRAGWNFGIQRVMLGLSISKGAVEEIVQRLGAESGSPVETYTEAHE